MHQSGDVVELVDTLGLEPSAVRRGGSTPSIPTIYNTEMNNIAIFGKKGSIAKYDISLNKAIWVGKLNENFIPNSIAQIKNYLLVYSNTSFSGKSMIHCFSEDNGDLLWSYLAKDICNSSYPFKPTLLDDYLYYMPSSKEVAKMSIKNGELIFRKKFEKSIFNSYGLIVISENVILISKKDALIINKESGEISLYPEISEALNLKEISATLGNGTSYLSSISLAYPQQYGDSGFMMTGGGDAGGGGSE